MNKRIAGKRLGLGLATLAALVAGGALTGAALTSSSARATPFVVTQAGTGMPAEVGIGRPLGAAAPAFVVSQKDRMFDPDNITIRAHQFITIKNDDDTTHHLYCSAENLKYNSGPMHVGESASIMFPNPGTYQVRCAIHPKMILQVTVMPIGQ
jgi:plastocyanin